MAKIYTHYYVDLAYSKPLYNDQAICFLSRSPFYYVQKHLIGNGTGSRRLFAIERRWEPIMYTRIKRAVSHDLQ